MTFAASGGDVCGRERRAIVLLAINAVRSMATRAHCGDRQARLIEAEAMHILGVGSLVFFMTTAAGLHLIVKIDGRLMVACRQNFMGGLAVAAAAIQLRAFAAIVFRTRLAVDALEQLDGLFLVAIAANLFHVGQKMASLVRAVFVFCAGVSAVAILTIYALLPVNILFEHLRVNKKLLQIAFHLVRIVVASNANDFVRWKLRTFW